MKSKILALAFIFSTQYIMAQIPEDAIRMSWNTPSGTARQQAIGGAMGSLGGEITTIFVNPAGLGMYKTGEFVLSPGLSLLNGKSNFRGTDASANSLSKFNFGTTGFVLGFSDQNSKWKSKSFGLAINRTANFNSTTYYKGQNDFSSFSESFAEEFARSNLPIDAILYDAPLSLGTKLANYTYLIDTVTVNGNVEVVGLPQRNAILAGADALLDQEKRIESKGGITEVAFGFASNMDDKIYIGASLGVPIVNYERSSTITETDASGLTNNNFNYATYREEYTAKGVGINAKLGLIVKPSSQLRVGLAIHSPSWYGLREVTTGSIEADLENYFPPGKNIRRANEDTIYAQYGAANPEFKYDLVSPWKFIVSGSYVFRAVEDVTQQRGFITADLEYVTHRSSKFRSAEETQNDDYYDAVNDAVKAVYKGAFNLRVGGELKFKTIMTRLGFAYYGNPYKEKTFEGADNETIRPRRMNVSGGLGWRNKGMFVDLTYVQSLNRDINFPYRLSDKANTFASVRDNTGNVLLTLGFKF